MTRVAIHHDICRELRSEVKAKTSAGYTRGRPRCGRHGPKDDHIGLCELFDVGHPQIELSCGSSANRRHAATRGSSRLKAGADQRSPVLQLPEGTIIERLTGAWQSKANGGALLSGYGPVESHFRQQTAVDASHVYPGQQAMPLAAITNPPHGTAPQH